MTSIRSLQQLGEAIRFDGKQPGLTQAQLPQGQGRRLHQENFCQALGLVAEMKSQNEGGPGLTQCFELVRRVRTVFTTGYIVGSSSQLLAVVFTLTASYATQAFFSQSALKLIFLDQNVVPS